MKQNNHLFRRAMLFIAVLFTSFLGVAASTPDLLTDTELPKWSAPTIYLGEGVGKYTVQANGVVGSKIYYRVNSGEWIRYKTSIVFDEYGSYLFEAYATCEGYAPSDIVSKSFVVDEHTGENLVDPDADDPTIIFHDGFKYKINGSTLSLTRQTDAMVSGDLVIPPSITHNGVTYPVTEVESWACYNVNNITTVQIPSTVTEIGLYAFNHCTKLRSIEVDPDNPNYCDRDGVLYNKSGIYLLDYPNARATEYTIPDGVTMIYYSAFQEDVDLVSVTIPNSVTSIRTSAFSCCFSLESIVLPNNLGNLDAGAFEGCRELRSATLSTKYNKIPAWCFSGCTSLESIVIPPNVRTIEDWAFEDCTSLSSVTLSEGLKTIAGSAFQACRSIPEITIPRTVTSIGDGAFYRCTGLTNIFVDPSNSYYCDVDGVLYNKNQTTLLSYPLGNPRLSYDILPTTQTVTTKAFESCGPLEQLNIPSGVTTTGESAFANCKHLRSIFIPNTVTSMGRNAFGYCDSLRSVTLEDGLKVLASNAFGGCKSLVEVNFSSDLTTINEGAFRNCHALTKLTLPNSVSTIGQLAFYDCRNLTSINIPTSLTAITHSMLESCKLTEVTIPAGVTSIDTYGLACSTMRIVNCLAETPPEVANSNCFSYGAYNYGTLLVPPASVEAYKSAPIWCNFTTTKGFFVGDTDGDGELTISDVTKLISFVLVGGNNGACSSINADSNGDGVIDISDVTKLIHMVLCGN